MSAPNLLLGVVSVLLGGWLLRRHAWRAALFFQPAWMRLEVDAPADHLPLPASAQSQDAALRALGFSPLGSHCEEAPLGPVLLALDYALAGTPVFATLEVSEAGGPRLYFLSHTEEGGFVITADHRRPAHEQPGRYVSGGIEGAQAERLLRVHQKRLESFSALPARSLEQRVDAGRAWWRGAGRSEVRQQNLLGLLWSLGTLGMVGSILFNLFGR